MSVSEHSAMILATNLANFATCRLRFDIMRLAANADFSKFEL